MDTEKTRNPVDIAERLKAFMESHGLTQETLANAIGVSTQTVSSWFTRRRSINATELQKIAYKFNVSADYLLHLDTPPIDLLTNEQKRLSRKRTKILDLLGNPNYKDKWISLAKELKTIQQELSDVENRLATAKFGHFTPIRVPLYSKIDSITPEGITGDQIGYAYTPVAEVKADIALKIDNKIFFIKLNPDNKDLNRTNTFVFTLAGDSQITTVDKSESADGVVVGYGSAPYLQSDSE